MGSLEEKEVFYLFVYLYSLRKRKMTRTYHEADWVNLLAKVA